jgi:hypothetical protein
LSTAIKSGAAKSRRVYKFSVVPGGVTSRSDLVHMIRTDKVVAEHYAGFAVDKASLQIVDKPRAVHVSYRKGDKVYWTANKVMLARGETVLSDGHNLIRTRCGNRISDTPQLPVEANGPGEDTLDSSADDAAGDGSTVQASFAPGADGVPGQGYGVTTFANGAGLLTSTSAAQARELAQGPLLASASPAPLSLGGYLAGTGGTPGTTGGTSGGSSTDGGTSSGGTTGGTNAGGTSGGTDAGGTNGGTNAGGSTGGTNSGGTSGSSNPGGTTGGTDAGGSAGGGTTPGGSGGDQTIAPPSGGTPSKPGSGGTTDNGGTPPGGTPPGSTDGNPPGTPVNLPPQQPQQPQTPAKPHGDVPEPATPWLIGSAAAALLLARRMRRAPRA